MATGAIPKWIPVLIVVLILVILSIGGGIAIYRMGPWTKSNSSDGQGGNGTHSTNKLPIAEAGPTRSVKANERVYLSGMNSYDPDGDRLVFKWDFNRDTDGDGDGISDNDFSLPYGTMSMNTSTIYYTPGDYHVLLNVSDGRSGYDTDTCLIHVLENTTDKDPPVVLLACHGTNGTLFNPEPSYIISVMASTPEDVLQNYTVIMFNLTNASTMDIYYSCNIEELDGTQVDLTDTDMNYKLSKGDFFKVVPSTDLAVKDGDYFGLTHTTSPDFPITYIQFKKTTLPS